MLSEIDAQRQKFEARFPHHRKLWLATYPDGEYRREDIQDAWLLFLSGWLCCREYLKEST